MVMVPASPIDRVQDGWLAASVDVQRTTLSLLPGRLYRFCGFQLSPRDGKPGLWRVPPGDYRMVGVGQEVRTMQTLVAHVGVGGPDDGKMFFAPLASWAAYFTLIEKAPDPPTPEKACGAVHTGSGV